MGFVADGSRICFLSRTPMAAIDAHVVLPSKFDGIIFAGGVYLDSGPDVFSALSGDTMQWEWADDLGIFTPVGPTGEIKYGDGTVLFDGVGVSSADMVTTQTPTSVSNAFQAFQLHSGGPVLGTLNGLQGSESQISLNTADAISGKVYQMQLVCYYNGGLDTAVISFGATFTVPETPKEGAGVLVDASTPTA